MRRLLVITLAAALAAGCGEERTPPPDVRHPEPPADGTKRVRLPAGLTFEAPGNWPELQVAPPLEGGVSSRSAIVALWRYPRTEPLPAGERQLERARERLLERIQLRNPTFVVRSSELVEVDGAPGVELTGRQTIGGLTYDVRSAHFFKDGTEVVVDAYAFPADFPEVDREVFAPLIDSLTIYTE